MQALTISLIIVLCGALAWIRRRHRAARVKEEWDIREATFLYQTRGLGANPCYLEATCVTQPVATVLALPDDFMKRLMEKGRDFKRSSECEATAQGIVDRKTGQEGGYIFTVSDIFWISPTDVEVSGGLSVGTTAGTSKTYYLKKGDGHWHVVGEHLKSISCS